MFPRRIFRAMLAPMPSEQRAVRGDDPASLRSACVKVTCDDGTVGTGYLVATDRVVTCEHVVRRVKAGGQVLLTLLDGSTHEAHVERMDAAADVALLRLPQGAPSITPLRLVDAVELNRPFSVIGFPRMMQGASLLLTGHVHDPVGRDRRGASAVVRQAGVKEFDTSATKAPKRSTRGVRHFVLGFLTYSTGGSPEEVHRCPAISSTHAP